MLLIDEPESAGEEAQIIYGYTLTILETLEHAYNTQISVKNIIMM